jgi:L-ascorbate metabolism protein UlaG (beta-lactamase superfamily)
MNNKGILIAIIALAAVVILGAVFLVNSDPVTENVQTSTTTLNSQTTPATNDTADIVAVTPIEHASAVLTWETNTLYLDPVGDAELYADASEPNIIFLTDIHADHLSTSTLEAVTATGTLIIAPQAVADLLPDELQAKTTVLANGSTTQQRGFSIEAVPMYNLPESDDSRHEKGRGNGYVIERNGTRVYVAGDTSDTPEMRAMKDIDIAFVPMNMPFTMSVESAADAVLEFAPRTVYPYHYRGQAGLADVNKFRTLVSEGNPNIEVILLNWYPDDAS